ELGSLSQVLEGRLARTLKQGIRHRDIAALEKELEGTNPEADSRRVVEEELEEARERHDGLKAQIQRLRGRLETSQNWLALREDHFRSALSCALQMMHADPLKPIPKGDDWEKPIERFLFPALDQRQGADPTWAGTMDQDVVHLHLEHRVVQRLLGRFTAQGFVHHDLSRACLSQTQDAIPRVILMGRLCLYGPRAARLHKELVPVTARWVELSQRKKALSPYGREAEVKTLDLLESALLPKSGPEVGSVIQAKLREAAPRDIAELRPHLDERARELA